MDACEELLALGQAHVDVSKKLIELLPAIEDDNAREAARLMVAVSSRLFSLALSGEAKEVRRVAAVMRACSGA
jgi:hypothetical protein